MDAFDLTGRALCLDLANTWEDRGRPETDRLGTYPDLLAFGRQAGVLDAAAAADLARLERRDPAGAAAALETTRALRERLYRIFAAVAGGGDPEPADLEGLNEALGNALPGLRVIAAGDRFTWGWSPAPRSLLVPLRPIALSAAELLTSDELDRVRQCDGRRCTWLFLDRSRNRARRWCSMATCGNRAKARRHYRRRKRTQ